MIYVGVIGCGKIAQARHLPEYADNADCCIAAVYDINQNRTNEVAGRYGAKAYTSYQSLLVDPAIDAVSVCAANTAHAQITIDALTAGKHVLCEKPMAMSLEECEVMVDTAQRTGKYLMIGHNQRLTKAHEKARDLLRQGQIGRVLTFQTVFGHSGPETWSIDPGKNVWFFDRKKAGMGAMADLGIHKTDLIQFLTGQTAQKITAYLGTLDKRGGNGELIGVDDNAICIYEMDNGIVGTMTASWTYYGPEINSTLLFGTEGVMRIYDDPRYSIIIERRGGEKVCYELEGIQTNKNQTKSGVIDRWIDCLVNNRPPEISGVSALSAMRAVFGAIESAKSGKTINLEGGV